MNILRALTTPGWMAKDELEYLARVASNSDMIAEIGSWRGRSSLAIADNTFGSVVCVDTWSQGARGHDGWWTHFEYPRMYDDPDWLWKQFRANTAETNIIPMRSDSLTAAGILAESGIEFDMIFIDADHSEEALTKDIEAWSQLLKDGGILAGHDYGSALDPTVKPVVDRMIPKFRLVNTIWTTEE